jgi:hypothetical protein
MNDRIKLRFVFFFNRSFYVGTSKKAFPVRLRSSCAGTVRSGRRVERNWRDKEWRATAADAIVALSV